MKHAINFFIVFFLTLLSCEGYLDVKPRSELVVPNTLEDFQQLLDNGAIMYTEPELLEILSDDYYFEKSYWQSISDQVVRNAHVWAEDIYGTVESHSSWSSGYQKVFYANVVLDGLVSIPRTSTNATRYDQIKGQALFVRAKALYTLAQLFAYPYTPGEDSEFGLPLPIKSDVNEVVSRQSVQETYRFIVDDLRSAMPLLPEDIRHDRPSRVAVYGLLARVYLVMGDYAQAKDNAIKALAIYDDITDLNAAGSRSYRSSIYLSIISPASYITNLNPSIFISAELMGLYDPEDLRLIHYYRYNAQMQPSKKDFRGIPVSAFSGLDTEEMILIYAECLAREEAVGEAIAQMERLLVRRYRTGHYSSPSLTDPEDVIEWVLQERRKELVFRGIRWSDIRRLNEQGYRISLERNMGDEVYRLDYEDRGLWTLPIPTNEVISSHIKQHIR